MASVHNNKKRSNLWKVFEEIDTIYAKCSMCKAKLSYKTSTSNLKRHMQNKHPTVSLGTSQTNGSDSQKGSLTPSNANREPARRNAGGEEISTTSVADLSTPSTSTLQILPQSHATKRKQQHQQKDFTYMPKQITFKSKKNIDDTLLGLFSESFQPFRLVEEPPFTKFVAALNPTYQLPSRHTISQTLIPALYEQCRNQVGIILKTSSTYCLTTDFWSSINNESYMAVTVHFVDTNFKFKSALLECSSFKVSHASENLANELQRIVSEWDIQRNQISLAVSDNAANIVNAIKNKLSWKHFNCLAHTLNLIVTDGLKSRDILAITDKVKTIVSHFNKSHIATEKLLTFQRRTGNNSPLKLLPDCPRRWNSAYYMIQRFTQLEKAVKSTVAILNTVLPTLTQNEWKILHELCQVLSPFESVSKCISEEIYDTASLVIPLVNGLNSVCKKLATKQFSTATKAVVTSLIIGLEDRLGNVNNNTTLSTCTFLDPRFKHVAFSDEQVSETVKKNVIAAVSLIISRNFEQLQILHQEHKFEADDKSAIAMDTEFSVWDEFDKNAATLKPKSTVPSKAIIEVQRYMEADILPRGSNPLQWWNENKYMYRYLSILAQENLGTVATSVPCKRLFSKAELLISERLNRLSGTKAKMSLFINVNRKLLE